MASCNMRFHNKVFSKISLYFHFVLASVSVNKVCDFFFLIKGAINKLGMYKYLQKNSLNMITNVNSSLPEVYFVIYDWLGT